MRPMRATKITLILIIMCGVALGAGVVAGKLTTRTPAPLVPIVSPGAGLTDELALTSEQREQMRQIWESVRDTAETCSRQAQTAEKQMQAELIGMLTDEQKARYEKLSNGTKAKIDSLNAYRQHAFKDAVDRTLQILKPDQRKAYEQIVKNRIGQLPQDTEAPAQPTKPSGTLN